MDDKRALSAEEWGELQAQRAPIWSVEQLQRTAALLGLTLRPRETEADSNAA